MPVAEIKNFLEIRPGLVTGGQPSEEQLRDVAHAGYEVVVNLGLLDPRYALADEAGLVRSLGLEYHHVPVVFDAPTVEEYERFESILAAAGAKRVFVHCAANLRVTAFVSLYGEERLGMTRSDAEALASRFWSPNAVWQSFLDGARARLAERRQSPAQPPTR